MSRVVFSAANEFEARLACDLLRAHDIPYRTSGSALTGLRGVLPVPEAAVVIKVLHAHHVERARALLGDIEGRRAETDTWICGRCEEESPGAFDLCWKCGAARDVSGFAQAASPYRGDRPAAQAEAPAESLAPPGSADARRDVFRVLLAACLPVALIGVWFDRNDDIIGPTSGMQLAGMENLAAAVVLGVNLWFVRSRVALRKVWGARERWAVDTLGALLLGVVLVVVQRGGYELVRSLGGLPPYSSTPFATPPASAGAWVVLCIGAALSAATGALLFFGILLERLRDLFGRGALASAPAILLGAAIMTLTWAPVASWPTLGGLFATELLLCTVFVVVGRVWPMAVASFCCYVLRWLIVALQS